MQTTRQKLHYFTNREGERLVKIARCEQCDVSRTLHHLAHWCEWYREHIGRGHVCTMRTLTSLHQHDEMPEDLEVPAWEQLEMFQ